MPLEESGAGEIVWRPSAAYADGSRLAHFMKSLGIDSLATLQRRSVADPAWYWDAVVRDLGVRWTRPYGRVLDLSRGIQWPRWFEGGLLNLAENCLERNIEAGRGAQPAIIWEGDDGSCRTLTYSELAGEVNRLANTLTRLGIREGDCVGIFLPMCPEAAMAALAVARLGAMYSPCFSGYGAQAVAVRLQDSEAKVLITADGFPRRGQVVRMKETADEAVAASPTVKHLLVCRRVGRRVPWVEGRDLWWHEEVPQESPVCASRPVEVDRPYLLVYTSGTTGRPKGIVLTHGGFPIKHSQDFSVMMDVNPGDRVFWLSDLGWLMGPILITTGLFHGATAVLFEGVPDYPGPDRLWALVERHRITLMGLSPTAVRGLMAHGVEPIRAHDLSSLRILGSTGEPWNPEPYDWFFRNVGQGRLPIMNYTGGTEAGGILGCFPVAPIKPCGFTGPIPGMGVDCYDDDGRPVRGQVGELVVTAPWPGMTQGFWKDPQRYEETYWSRWKDVWVHGDWAYVDADGFWFILGRSDDTLKVAGKRLGPAEVESVLVSHPAVIEAVVVGVPHEVKGEAMVCFVVLGPGAAPSEALRGELAARIVQQMGRALSPERILFARDVPKTRSGKIMRRVVRASYLGHEPGDLSALENPDALGAIAQAT